MSFAVFDKIDFAKLDILTAACYYGLDHKKFSAHRYRAACCFHHERTPSLTLFTDNNTFYCFGCGAKGSVWQFVSLQEQTDDKKVIIEKIREIYNLTTIAATPATVAQRMQPQPPIPKVPPKQQLVTTHHAAYADLLDFCSQHPNPKGYEYLVEERKLSPAIIESFMIRTFDGKELEQYLKSKYTIGELQQLGLVSESGFFGYKHYQIVIPYFDEYNQIFQLQFRTHSHNAKQSKYRLIKGLPSGVYNLHNLHVCWGGHCAITEGVIDCLSVYELNNYLPPPLRFDVVVALPSATKIDKSLFDKLLRQQLRVSVFIDSDSAGEKVKQQLTTIATKIRLPMDCYRFPQCKDVNEFLLLYTKDAQKI